MKKFLSVLLILGSSPVFSLSFQQNVNFCEEKRESLISDYENSMQELEVFASNLEDIGTRFKAHLLAKFDEVVERERYDRIASYATEVNNVVPRSLQQNKKYIEEMFNKYELGDLRYDLIRAADKSPGNWLENEGVFSPITGDYILEFKFKKMDEIIRLGKPFEFNVLDGGRIFGDFHDLAGRSLTLTAKLSLQYDITNTTYLVNILEQDKTLSAPTRTAEEYVQKVLNRDFPECAEYLY